MIKIIIDNVEYDIGVDINYPQMNPTTGAHSDKVKYRLTQQNSKILAALQAIADYLERINAEVQLTQVEYIWAADDNTIMASDDDTILMFYSDVQSYLAVMNERIDNAEDNINELASQPVLTYSDNE